MTNLLLTDFLIRAAQPSFPFKHNTCNVLSVSVVQGDVQNAIQQYTSALSSLEKVHGQNDERYSLAATLYSNRAMCHLKLAESNTQQTSSKEINTSLTNRIEDCTTAVEKLEGLENTNNLLGKILYRRARALAAKATNPDNVGDDVVEKALNESAKDLLKLLSFDSKNKEAATLLRIVKAQHAKLGGERGRTRISRSLDYIQKVINGDLDKNVTTIKNMDGEEKELDPLSCLRILQGSVAEDTSSSSEDIGRRNGVPLLLQIARQGLVSKQLDSQQKEQCRVAALHILSACCSHDPFLLKYGGRSHLPPAVLAQIVEEEAALSNDEFGGDGSADVAVAAMALLVRVIVHWDHREVARYFAPKINKDGTVDDANVASLGEHVPEVDGSSICRVAAAAFLWGSQSNNSNEEADTRPPRAALDLISAWTASDLEALDAASDACFAAPASDSGGDSKQSATRGKRASSHKLTPEDIRRMKPRQVASHRKRESEFTRASLERAIAHIGAFCSNQTGGLDAMLTCAAKTKDVRLRREVGLQIGRMMSVYNEDEDIKKLVSTALGCTDWTVGKEDENGNVVEMSSLTIEELDEEKEMDEEAEKSEEARLLAMMKCGQLTSSMLLGKPAVGTWALKYGWSDGNGVDELKALISSANSRAMSIASELVSAASSVESSRPLLATLVAEGTLQDLLIHPDADVRSGAASCAAKIGLASKALSADEDGVMGLLDIAIELLFDKNEHLDTESTTKALSKVPKSKAATEETTSMDRGIEVMAYLASKTFVKERICNGYVPKGSPKNRKTVLERLVELALTPSNGSQTQMAYGLAGIFNLLAVSIETLRKEAFVGKEITREQYDQLQSLGKTEEEKEAEAKTNESEGDTPTAVGERIRKLAKANVPRAMVKLLEGSGSSSDAYQEKILEGMGRMSCEPSVRGLMIQQGCLTACLQLDKGVSHIIRMVSLVLHCV